MKKLIATLALGLAVLGFSAAGFAQDGAASTPAVAEAAAEVFGARLTRFHTYDAKGKVRAGDPSAGSGVGGALQDRRGHPHRQHVEHRQRREHEQVGQAGVGALAEGLAVQRVEVDGAHPVAGPQERDLGQLRRGRGVRRPLLPRAHRRGRGRVRVVRTG